MLYAVKIQVINYLWWLYHTIRFNHLYNKSKRITNKKSHVLSLWAAHNGSILFVAGCWPNRSPTNLGLAMRKRPPEAWLLLRDFSKRRD